MKWCVGIVAAVMLSGCDPVDVVTTFHDEASVDLTVPKDPREVGSELTTATLFLSDTASLFLSDTASLDGEVFEESELATELAARGIRGETHRVILRVEDTIAHGRMVDARDTLDAANIYTIIEVVSE